MFIEKLELKNFRSHTPKTQFEFDRINVVRGLHGTGKSSIALAIEFLLTGACAVTDAAGRGAEALTSFGQEEFGVRGSIGFTADRSAPGAVITRTRGARGGNLLIVANKKNLTAKIADAWMDDKLGSRAVLSAVLNSSRFLAMADKDRKQLLTGALAADPVKLPDEIREMLGFCEEAHALCDDGLINTPADADLVEKKVREWRTSIGRALREMGELTEPERPANMPSAKETQIKLDGLHGERTHLEREKANVLAGHQAKLDRLKRAHEDKKEYEPHLLSADEMARLDAIARKKESAGALDRQIATEKFAIQQGQNTLEQLLAAQESKTPATCETCGQPVPKKDLTDQINRTEHNIEIAQKELAELEAKREKMGDPADAEARLAAHRKAVPRVGGADAAILDLGKVPEKIDVRDYDEKIEEISLRITKGTQVVAQINQFEGQLKQFQQQKAQREQLEAKHAKAERLVEYFGPNGELRPLLMGDKLGAFTEKINAVLARFAFECKLSLDPFTVTVNYIDGINRATIDQLSESEAFRFGIAFQIALAEATGVKLVVIDRADLLLPSTRRFLTSALMESNLDQAFVLAAQEDFTLKSMPPAGVRIIDLAKNDAGQTVVSQIHSSLSPESRAERGNPIATTG